MPPLCLYFYEHFPEVGNEADCAGTVVELTPDQPLITLGRDPKSSIPIDCKLISRRHASIRWDSDLENWQILDGGKVWRNQQQVYQRSTLGVYVNGHRLPLEDWHTIKKGDKISLGKRLPAARFVVLADPNDTILMQYWEQPGWPDPRSLEGEGEMTEIPLGEMLPQPVTPMLRAIPEPEPVTRSPEYTPNNAYALTATFWADLKNPPKNLFHAGWLAFLILVGGGFAVAVLVAVLR